MSDPAGPPVNPILAPLSRALGGELPPALSVEPWEVMPLVIGARDALAARLVAHGLPAAEADQLAGRTLARWARTPTYLHALATDGACRHDLDGNRVEPVAKEHTLAAAMTLLTSALRDHGKRTGMPSGPPKPPKVTAEAAPPKPAAAAPTATRVTTPPAPKPGATRPTLTVKPRPR